MRGRKVFYTYKYPLNSIYYYWTDFLRYYHDSWFDKNAGPEPVHNHIKKWLEVKREELDESSTYENLFKNGIPPFPNQVIHYKGPLKLKADNTLGHKPKGECENSDCTKSEKYLCKESGCKGDICADQRTEKHDGAVFPPVVVPEDRHHCSGCGGDWTDNDHGASHWKIKEILDNQEEAHPLLKVNDLISGIEGMDKAEFENMDVSTLVQKIKDGVDLVVTDQPAWIWKQYAGDIKVWKDAEDAAAEKARREAETAEEEATENARRVASGADAPEQGTTPRLLERRRDVDFENSDSASGPGNTKLVTQRGSSNPRGDPEPSVSENEEEDPLDTGSNAEVEESEVQPEKSWKNLWGYWPEKTSHQALAVAGTVVGVAGLGYLCSGSSKPKTPFAALAEKIGANVPLVAGVTGATLLAGGVAAHQMYNGVSSEVSESESSELEFESIEVKTPVKRSVAPKKPAKKVVVKPKVSQFRDPKVIAAIVGVVILVLLALAYCMS